MDFERALQLLKDHFPLEAKKFKFEADNILAIYCRKVQKVETNESSSSNIQENTSKVEDFFPILENSQNFPYTRLKIGANAPQSSKERRAARAESELSLLEGEINYRRKEQNGSPYIQLSLSGELSAVKSAMKQGDEIIFIRTNATKDPIYLILLSQNPVFDSHRSIFINQKTQSLNGRMQYFSAEFSTPDRDVTVREAEYNKIYFGAPGTGKSYQIRKDIEELRIAESDIETVVFHPEYDYFSFVGGFKPNNQKGKDIEYSFVEQVFISIYRRAWDAIKQNDKSRLFLLIIEEINRGNCAEIFGDIFQLLDRNPNYSISPSTELRYYLEAELGPDHEAIKDGKLRLPENMLIWATMNTSDQSLFPLDSAFKRRWAWEYIPINYDRDIDKNKSALFRIRINENETFNWLEFIKSVNDLIRRVPHLGEDKCLGNYFINPKNNEMLLNEFINKVLFYIWCDVFRDEESEFFEEFTFYDLFCGEQEREIRIRKLLSHLNVQVS